MRSQFTFYRSFWDAIKELPPKDKNAVLSAVCEYALDGTEPILTGVQRSIFILIKPTLDTSARKAENGRRGGVAEAKSKQVSSKPEAKPKQTAREKENENEKENEKEIENDSYIGRKRPTVDEVAAYCKERGNQVDAQKWFDYYSSNGWRVGKNPMKDWRACVRTWERNNYDKAPQKKKFDGASWGEQPSDDQQSKIERMRRMAGL